MEDWPLIGARFAIYVALAALFGLSAFSLYGLRAEERVDALALRPWLLACAGTGLLMSFAWVVLTASSMAGTPTWPIDGEAVGALLTGSAIGVAWKVRMVALAVAALAATRATYRDITLATVALAGAVALATLAWTGHGAMDDAAMGWLHLSADIIHLIASGIWVGALLGLVLLVSRRSARVDAAYLALTHGALHGFGAVGTVTVAAIVVTGLVNGWILVGIGNSASLGTTLYGQLLLLKFALFAAMLGLASLNRFRLTPTFERSIANGDSVRALGGLRRSLGVEIACVVLILALVAWLGMLEPPMSTM